MTEAVWVVLVLVGLVGGVALGWWLGRQSLATHAHRVAELDEALATTQRELATANEAKVKAEGEADKHRALLDSQTAQLEEAKAETEALRGRLEKAFTENLGLVGDIRELRRTVEERDNSHKAALEALENAKAQLSDHFKALAGEALDKSTETLLKQAREVLDNYSKTAEGDIEKRKEEIARLVQPIHDQLKGLDETNRTLEQARSQTVGELKEQLEQLGKQGVSLQQETVRLTKALQSSGVAGNWGEVILERLLEMSGLQEGVAYFKQDKIADDDGVHRPDIKILMPGGKHVFVDSKMPASYYLQALEDCDEPTKQQRLVVFTQKLADHVKALARKTYHRGENSADFTVLFLGSDAMYYAAMEIRPTLVEEALTQDIVIATPSSLFVVLKSVHHAWRQQAVADNALAIRDQGARLYDTLCTITEHYHKLGTSIEAAAKAYNQLGVSLERNAVTAAGKLRKMGIETKKKPIEVKQLDASLHTLTKPELTRALVADDQPALPDPSDLTLTP